MRPQRQLAFGPCHPCGLPFGDEDFVLDWEKRCGRTLQALTAGRTKKREMAFYGRHSLKLGACGCSVTAPVK